tara:strand:- start:1192 stop:2838 length:1647 start_codon:yes stop_codon:yes gene_type:complete
MGAAQSNADIIAGRGGGLQYAAINEATRVSDSARPQTIQEIHAAVVGDLHRAGPVKHDLPHEVPPRPKPPNPPPQSNPKPTLPSSEISIVHEQVVGDVHNNGPRDTSKIDRGDTPSQRQKPGQNYIKLADGQEILIKPGDSILLADGSSIVHKARDPTEIEKVLQAIREKGALAVAGVGATAPTAYALSSIFDWQTTKEAIKQAGRDVAARAGQTMRENAAAEAAMLNRASDIIVKDSPAREFVMHRFEEGGRTADGFLRRVVARLAEVPSEARSGALRFRETEVPRIEARLMRLLRYRPQTPQQAPVQTRIPRIEEDVFFDAEDLGDFDAADDFFYDALEGDTVVEDAVDAAAQNTNSVKDWTSSTKFKFGNAVVHGGASIIAAKGADTICGEDGCDDLGKDALTAGLFTPVSAAGTTGLAMAGGEAALPALGVAAMDAPPAAVGLFSAAETTRAVHKAMKDAGADDTSATMVAGTSGGTVGGASTAVAAAVMSAGAAAVTGGEIGTAFAPETFGLSILIGAGIGAVVGAAGSGLSLLFGGGKSDEE